MVGLIVFYELIANMVVLYHREIRECFSKISNDADCRAVVLTGAGKIFTAGKCTK